MEKKEKTIDMSATMDNLITLFTSNFDALNKKLDSIDAKISPLTERVAKLEGKPVYEQPCPLAREMSRTLTSMQADGCRRLSEHLSAHKEMRSDWRRGLISVLSGVLIGALSMISAYAVKGWLYQMGQPEQKIYQYEPAPR